MRFRWLAVPVSTLSLAACGGATSAEPRQTDESPQFVNVVLDFCSSQISVALQNQGAAWTRVPLDNGKALLQTTRRVGLALSVQDGSRVSTSVLFGTSDELQSVFGSCDRSGGETRTLQGSVAGLSTDQGADITMSSSSAWVTLPSTTFSLTGLPTRPVDLVAFREGRSFSDDHAPNRLIVRRDVALPTGATMPVLDFSALEAVEPATNTLTTTSKAGERDDLLVYFTTANGTRRLLQLSSIPGGIHTVFGVPASLTRAGDLHELFAARAETDGSFRAVVLFRRNPGDRVAAFGPMLSTPAITTVTTTPSLRMRARLASQTDYGAFVQVIYHQCQFGDCTNITQRSFSILMTSGYLAGTPATWDLEMPDLSNISGFPTAARLENGVATSWDIQAANTLLLEGTVTDGTDLYLAERDFAPSGSTSQVRSQSDTPFESLGMTRVSPLGWRKSVIRQVLPR
jgi:hypothetical protein